MNLDELRYDGSRKLCLKDVDTGAGKLREQKQELILQTGENMTRCAQLQEKLMAEGREGLIIAIQARDGAGKDSLIRHLFGCLNPAGLKVTPFKTPTKTELAHDYLWRMMLALPERGGIGIFNRSHYEDVLVTRVHQMEKGYRMPARVIDDPAFYRKRYRQLRDWEQYLYENGYRMVKILLHVGKEEQSKRFLDRMELEAKHYKLSLNDLNERALWSEYDRAYEDAVNATGTPESPWYVLPADNKWYTRYLASEILLDILTKMDPQFPPLPAADLAQIPAAIERLAAERAAKPE